MLKYIIIVLSVLSSFISIYLVYNTSNNLIYPPQTLNDKYLYIGEGNKYNFNEFIAYMDENTIYFINSRAEKDSDDTICIPPNYFYKTEYTYEIKCKHTFLSFDKYRIPLNFKHKNKGKCRTNKQKTFYLFSDIKQIIKQRYKHLKKQGKDSKSIKLEMIQQLSQINDSSFSKENIFKQETNKYPKDSVAHLLYNALNQFNIEKEISLIRFENDIYKIKNYLHQHITNSQYTIISHNSFSSYLEELLNKYHDKTLKLLQDIGVSSEFINYHTNTFKNYGVINNHVNMDSAISNYQFDSELYNNNNQYYNVDHTLIIPSMEQKKIMQYSNHFPSDNLIGSGIQASNGINDLEYSFW